MSLAPDPATGEPGKRTFVGFGLGAIQAGLFLLEAQASGAFGRLVVAEVVSDVVAAVRAAGGIFTVNVAHANGIRRVQVGPVEIYNPADESDRVALVAAIAQAHELATAVPSVEFYTRGGAGSIQQLLAAGLAAKAADACAPRAVLYAAENHNHAAEILRAAVAEGSEPSALESICFVNTVIGKMSGAPPAFGTRGEEAAALAPMTPGFGRAFLVEAFNRILISPARLPSGAAVERGLQVFVEKADLLPFEEAKLWVHNALHAMAAYLGAAAGLQRMSQLPEVPAILALTRSAVLQESGAALVLRYAGGDPLFTPAGMAAYADDLFERMVNPWLADEIVRVGRDPLRKLAWDDRLIGAMRAALRAGIAPRRLALGAAAALQQAGPEQQEGGAWLRALWNRPPADEAEVETLVALIEAGGPLLRAWVAAGFTPADPTLEAPNAALQRIVLT